MDPVVQADRAAAQSERACSSGVGGTSVGPSPRRDQRQVEAHFAGVELGHCIENAHRWPLNPRGTNRVRVHAIDVFAANRGSHM